MKAAHSMKHILSYFLFFCLFNLLFIQYSGAQQYNFKTYSTKQGLAGSAVNNIFQDSRGYIWFATQTGVSKFNGKSFQNFTKDDGLITNDITYIKEDKEGEIWIGTAEGISVYNGSKFRNFNDKTGFTAGKGIYWIYVDSQNVKWIAVRGVGVAKYDGKSFTYFTKKDGLPSEDVFCITGDGHGNYWFGTSAGVVKYDGTRITTYDKSANVDNVTFFTTLLDSKGNIWFSGPDGNVIKYNGTDFQKIALPDEVKSDFIGSIAEDKKGNFWFATDHGVLKLENDNFHLFTEKEGLSNNSVYSVFADYESNMWIGTLSGGVNLFNNESFVNFTDKDGLNSMTINCMIKDIDDKYLLGTAGAGLNIFNPKENRFEPLTNIKELVRSNIITITLATNHDVWLGTTDGLFILARVNGRFQLKKAFHKIAGNKLTAIMKVIEDRNGVFWIASYGGGIYKINGIKEEVLNVANGLPSDNVLTLHQDSYSNLWIGTSDAGVIRYDGKELVTFSEKEGLANKSVWSIANDNNILFFGTGDNGISTYDGKTFKTINSTSGLCSNYILGLAWDNKTNSLWVGTDKGVNNVFLKENRDVKLVRYFSELEGFKGEVVQNAILPESNGLIYFGTNNGLCRFNRKYDFPKIIAPKVEITDVRLSYEKVDWQVFADSVDPKTQLPVNLILCHNNNNLTFSFQALSTDNIRYTYMLEGMSDEWSPLSENTTAIFTNITPGKHYTFKIKSVNSNGVWSVQPATFSFKVDPPWWNTWWFRISTVLLLFTMIIILFRWRTASLRRDKERLEQIIVERTAEVVLQKDEAEKQKALVEEKNHEITDSINYAVRIQQAILPDIKDVKKILPESFILFKPKDIVSGDFYFFKEDFSASECIIAAADCTGHGVPGAFMSMIGSEQLKEAVSKSMNTSEVLQLVNKGIKRSLRQSENEDSTRDGMDIAVCSIDAMDRIVTYSGANRPLWIIRKNSLDIEETKATKKAIGGHTEDDQAFELHTFQLSEGDIFYIFTDGYADQFSYNDKKLMTKKFKQVILANRHTPMHEQKKLLDEFIEDWKGGMEQTDDILVIGVKL
jgi:ligand-binding sensor domain-containing protein/serine phosphatase RsbU (regulator of sigma subunit)